MPPTWPSRPPICESSRSPSIVCVLISARSSSVERARLVDHLGRDPDLADVVEERRELRVAPFARREAEVVADVEHELDDVARVHPGVLVVGLDHVAEQERRPAIGLRELEEVLLARLALAREEREERDERQHEDDRRGLLRRRDRDGEPDRREREVDEPRPPDEVEEPRRARSRAPAARGAPWTRSRTGTASRGLPRRAGGAHRRDGDRRRARARGPGRSHTSWRRGGETLDPASASLARTPARREEPLPRRRRAARCEAARRTASGRK